RTLPPEALSIIFQYTCASSTNLDYWKRPNEVHYRPIILASVSPYWREIAFGTPRLWNKMDFCVRRGKVETVTALLRHYTQHTKNLDLTINLALHHPHNENHTPAHRELANFLFSSKITRRITILG
ncbi:hypothetical protein P691DRAFT_626995, partial [Macrolepiota fuliginosa MF-IS2]